jgi:hypothetical protein
MVGFGPEDNHFVVELTYNYGVKKYKRGNDFQVSNDGPKMHRTCIIKFCEAAVSCVLIACFL